MHRARARGIGCRLIEVGLHQPIPRGADVYLLGGGEDASMLLAWRRLRHDSGLLEAVGAGAVVFGVCAGFQLLSGTFAGPDASVRQGLGLLDVHCGRLERARAVGEVLVESRATSGDFLTGFENHKGDARLGAGARSLGLTVRGVGNGDGTEGAIQGRVVATYLHGPALVRNHQLADHLLRFVVGELAPYDDAPVRRLRAERRDAVLSEHGVLRGIRRIRRPSVPRA
jgi:CobQ-like glutamine amidotransferase family enzyme